MLPFAVRNVRDSTVQLSLRDNTDYTYISPAFLKRRCYLEIYYNRGWVAVWLDTKKAKVQTNPQVSLMQEGFYLTQEGTDREDREDVKPIVLWRSFLRCWTENFQKLKVLAKGEDTCTDCYLLNQKLARAARQKAELLEQLDHDALDGITPEDLNAEIEGYQEVIGKFKKNVDIHFFNYQKKRWINSSQRTCLRCCWLLTWPKMAQRRF